MSEKNVPREKTVEETESNEPQVKKKKHGTVTKDFKKYYRTKGFFYGVVTTVIVIVLSLVVGLGISWVIGRISPSLPETTGVEKGNEVNAPLPSKVLKGETLKSGSIYFGKDLKATPTDPKQGKKLLIVADPACGYCYQFDKANMKDIEAWVKKGNTLEFRLIPMLDRQQHKQVIDFPIILTHVSATNPDATWDVIKGFYGKWVEGDKLHEWTVKDYSELLEESGVPTTNMVDAIMATKSTKWVEKADEWLQQASTLDDFQGTPYVRFNNKPLDKDLYYMLPGSVKSYLETGKVDPKFSIAEISKQQQQQLGQEKK